MITCTKNFDAFNLFSNKLKIGKMMTKRVSPAVAAVVTFVEVAAAVVAAAVVAAAVVVVAAEFAVVVVVAAVVAVVDLVVYVAGSLTQL